jgi:hypothetical protein
MLRQIGRESSSSEFAKRLGGSKVPDLSETLRLAGVTRNIWFLPAAKVCT